MEMDGCRVYITEKAEDAKRAIIMFSDVWGFGSGHHRVRADFFAKALGAVVYLPALQPQTGKYFTNQKGPDNDGLPYHFPFNAESIPDLMKWCALNPWSEIKKKIDVLMNHIKGKNYSRLDSIGFCWGVWAAFHASADNPGMFSSCVGFHPSVQVEAIFADKETIAEGLNPWSKTKFEIDGHPVAKLAKRVDHPVYLMPAGNDNKKLYGPTGLVTQVFMSKIRLRHACKIKYFEDMMHGYVSRGDRTDPKTNRDVTDAIKRAVAYLSTPPMISYL